MTPIAINIKPITLPHENCSPKKRMPNKKTITGAKLINGYAFVISSFVIAFNQKTDAIKAEKKPEKIKGSKINLIRNIDFSIKPSGKITFKEDKRHFKII
jgi:predicted GIY-YIG superfamily endonuclease